MDQRFTAAIEPVQGSRPGLGTAFCFAVDKHHAYYATCAHVVSDVMESKTPRHELKGKKVLLGGKEAIVEFVAEEGCDFAILKRPAAPDQPYLTLVDGASINTRFTAFGFEAGGGTVSSYKVTGKVEDTSNWDGVHRKYPRLDLEAEGKNRFKGGVSGGPILDDQKRVMGMATQEIGDGAFGKALDLFKLLRILNLDNLPFALDLQPNQEERIVANSAFHVPPLLPFQADRSDPKSRFLEILSQNPGPLLMAMVKGAEEAEHDKFLEVFGHSHLRLPASNVFFLEWNSSPVGFNYELESHLGLEKQRAGVSDLATLLAALPKGDILMVIGGAVEQLNPPNLNALRTWLRHWQDLTFDETRRIIIGIGIPFHEVKGPWFKRMHLYWWNRWLRMRVQLILGRIPGMEDVGELDLIPRGALGRWERETEAWLGRYFSDCHNRLRLELDQLYRQKRLLSMRTLARELHLLLTQLPEKLKRH